MLFDENAEAGFVVVFEEGACDDAIDAGVIPSSSRHNQLRTFLRSHGREHDGKERTYWSLVETVHTSDGPRQKTLCYLGELNSSAQTRWLTTVDVFTE